MTDDGVECGVWHFVIIWNLRIWNLEGAVRVARVAGSVIVRFAGCEIFGL